MYKNAVIRFFGREPKLLIAKENYIKNFVSNNSDVLMVHYLPTEEEAKKQVVLASKNWGGVYTIG